MTTTVLPLPLLGEKGRYFLKTPFQCDPTLLYQCTRLCTLSEALDEGSLDVWRDVYEANGISEEVYQSDVLSNVKLVFLSHPKKDPLIVPQSYLEQTPDQNYVPYSQVIITIDLGLLPHSLQLPELKQALSDIAQSYCQTETPVHEHRIDDGDFISYDEHLTLELKRLGGLIQKPSVYQRLRSLETENEALSTALRELQEAFLSESA